MNNCRKCIVTNKNILHFYSFSISTYLFHAASALNACIAFKRGLGIQAISLHGCLLLLSCWECWVSAEVPDLPKSPEIDKFDTSSSCKMPKMKKAPRLLVSTKSFLTTQLHWNKCIHTHTHTHTNIYISIQIDRYRYVNVTMHSISKVFPL